MNITCTYDTALPQPWVNTMTASGFDPRYEVVWGYPKGSCLGFPLPLTPRAAHKLASRVGNVELHLQVWREVGLDVEGYFPALSRLTPATK